MGVLLAETLNAGTAVAEPPKKKASALPIENFGWLRH